MSERASKVLRDLDEVSLLKLAISKVPLGHPVAGTEVRQTRSNQREHANPRFFPHPSANDEN